MKKSKRILIIFMSIMLILTTMQCVVSNAEDPSTGSSGMMSKIETLASSQSDSTAVSSVTTIAGSVISIAKVICAGIAIIMITVIAMKYMMAAPSEKADIKKHAVVYVVGAVIMFAATAILQIIQNFATSLD